MKTDVVEVLGGEEICLGRVSKGGRGGGERGEKDGLR